MTKPHHFEVHGPCRDYDYTTFCAQHHIEATECANEWMADVFDGLDVDESVRIEIRVCAGEPERCYACEPKEVGE